MDIFDVYPIYNIEPVKAEGARVWDNEGNQYLDFYGGHAVISIGHSHPQYVKRISEQVGKLGFYSNSVKIPIQKEVAKKLGELSGYEDWSLFYCNSGAEANENAFKLASFHNGKKRIIGFKGGFHGRTSLAVAVTDNPGIQAPVNPTDHITLLELNDATSLKAELEKGDVAAVIVEGIQGIGGIVIPDTGYMQEMRRLCTEHNTILILDEIQSGYGRSGKFFAHQYMGIKPDLITLAKGMGNGFPIGGLMISSDFEAKYGMLGTTFGGNHLACAAALAVLEVMEKEDLVKNAAIQGEYLKEGLKGLKGLKEVRGHGLMLGLEFDFPIKEMRSRLITEKKIFTGSAKSPKVLRLLPPLCITKADCDEFLSAIKAVCSAQ